jgi:pyrimidine-specific ribonucleoside hydrolase
MKYGLEEWKAALLTHEMHRHLGAYSIIGVKMGILAREILEADLDELTVVSYTGLNPPLSCLTDGLQNATGASLGRGTISNSTGSKEYPKALFISGSRKISIELKPEIMQRIQSEIIRLSNQYGYGTHRYFEEIRILSIHFWVNLNRKDMFEVYDYMTDE